MGCISFNEQYYRERLEALEHKVLTADDIYEAKQLLKVLDDLSDEGYTHLNTVMERDFSCLSRLRALIRTAGEEPFAILREKLPKPDYRPEEYELTALTEKLFSDAKAQPTSSDHPFLAEIRTYCDWIGYEDDTAYVFLFRDAMLPYLYYKSKGRRNLCAWPIGRRFLADLTGNPDADDDIRNVLYDALEHGCASFDAYSAYCRDGIRAALRRYPTLKSVLNERLSSIRTPKITVIESGYCGTIPMLLSAMDDRVSFRMFTTAPYWYDVYRERIFTRRYEDIRSFETLYSQDVLLQYASCRDGRFYMRMADSEDIMCRALSEMKRMTE